MDGDNKTMKVGNTSFQIEVVKKMSLKEFQGVYKDILKGQDLKSVYGEVTGAPSAVGEVKPAKPKFPENTKETPS